MRGRWFAAVAAVGAVMLGGALAPPAAAAPSKITRTGWSCKAPDENGRVVCKGTLRGIKADDYQDAIDVALLYLHRYSRDRGGYVNHFGGAGRQLANGRWMWHATTFDYGPEPSTWFTPIIDRLLAKRHS